MKNLTSILVLAFSVLFMSQSYSQEKFATYDNNYMSKTYDIKLSGDSKKYTLWINALSLDKMHETGGLMIEKKQHENFLNALNEAKLKYEEWLKTAKENNVKELSKKMSVKSKVGASFFYGSKWHFQFLVNLSFEFKIIEKEGELSYYLIIRTGELTASDNEFMKVDGFVIMLDSIEEIDTFANTISVEKVNEAVAKPKAEELFKD